MKSYIIRYMLGAKWHEVEQEGTNMGDAKLKFQTLHPDAMIGDIYQA